MSTNDFSMGNRWDHLILWDSMGARFAPSLNAGESAHEKPSAPSQGMRLLIDYFEIHFAKLEILQRGALVIALGNNWAISKPGIST